MKYIILERDFLCCVIIKYLLIILYEYILKYVFYKIISYNRIIMNREKIQSLNRVLLLLPDKIANNITHILSSI